MTADPKDDGLESEVTVLLRSWKAGDPGLSGRLIELLYGELKRIARRQLARERRAQTLQTTALVHEAYLRMSEQIRASFRDRNHFLAVATTLMRRILVDHARTRLAGKRAHERVSLTAIEELGAPEAAFEVLDLDRALDRLAAEFPRPARVVELRYFGGLELQEIAPLLSVSERTVKRDWAFGRAWLVRELALSSPVR
ncbi:MAG: sigma-70 family RNA polymerase sigma factor [Thermoanaerobaculia bacterium]